MTNEGWMKNAIVFLALANLPMIRDVIYGYFLLAGLVIILMRIQY